MSFQIELTFLAGDLNQIIREAPAMPMKRNDGTLIHEALTLVGDVVAPLSARTQLECYAICLALARFDEREGRWCGCLFSEASADTLVELGLEGQFPYPFEAVPSAGHLATLEAIANGVERPALPLRDWAMPASIEALSRAASRGLIQSSWLRRVVVGNEQRSEEAKDSGASSR